MKSHMRVCLRLTAPLAMALGLTLAGCGGGGSGTPSNNALPTKALTATITGTIDSLSVDSGYLGRQASAASATSDFTGFTAAANGATGSVSGNVYTIANVPIATNVLVEISNGKIKLMAIVPSVAAGKSNSKAVSLKTTGAASLWMDMGRPSSVSAKDLEDEYDANPAAARIKAIVDYLTGALADSAVAAALPAGKTLLDTDDCAASIAEARKSADPDAPTILSITPNNDSGAVDVDDPPISIRFSEPMDVEAELAGISISALEDATGTPEVVVPTATWSMDGQTLMLKTGATLEESTAYALTITLDPEELTDLAGNELDMPSSLAKTTVDGNDITVVVMTGVVVEPFEEGALTEHTAAEIKTGDSTFVTTFAGGTTIAGSGATYVGMQACAECHAEETEAYMETNHSDAWDRKVAGAPDNHFSSGCNYCHSLDGPKIPVWEEGASSPTRSLELGAFGLTATDYSQTAFEDVPENMRNIQCENCHGPASLHVDGAGDPDLIVSGAQAASATTCAVCHDAPTHHMYNIQWRKSGHSVSNIRASKSCSPCHSGDGFIEFAARNEEDPNVEIIDGLGTVAAPMYQANCAACHDPHKSTGEGNHQLRFPKEEICLVCHNGRKKVPGASHAPHHNIQGRIFFGQGGVDRDGVMYWPSDPTDAPPDGMTTAAPWGEPYMGDDVSCVDCHMADANHEFTPKAEACQACHANMDVAMTVGSKQAEFQAAFEPVYARLELAMADKGTFDENQTAIYNNAKWNLDYVDYDGSQGFHNPPYVQHLIDEAGAALEELGY